MQKNLLLFAFPPLAVCRYGCANCCVLPISGIWIAGLLLLYYFSAHAQQTGNNLIIYGSLASGIGLVSLAIVWSQNTIARNVQGRCDEKKAGKGSLCRMMPGSREPDPLEEIDRARKL